MNRGRKGKPNKEITKGNSKITKEKKEKRTEGNKENEIKEQKAMNKGKKT